MKYILDTEINAQGKKVFSKMRFGKGLLYSTKNEKGEKVYVDKKWVLDNRDDIINVGISKTNSIYPVKAKGTDASKPTKKFKWVLNKSNIVTGWIGDLPQDLTFPKGTRGFKPGLFLLAVMNYFRTITVPGSVERIPNNVFDGVSFKKLIIEEGVKYIGSYSFRYCRRLEHIIIPNSVVSIGDYAFENCYFLKTVSIPDSVINVGEGAFLGCRELQSVIISNQVTSISPYTFSDCAKLKSVVIPKGVVSIGDSAFAYCSALSSVTLPSTIDKVSSNAFYCMTHVNLEDTVDTVQV